ncbi:MAG: ABC transporter ATP-binding protein [Dehalococcoidales bacterium]|nr:ABC transporter ATP-binding protein [Dehalococcoidales bacterium]MDZ4230655.1 ABC transporter ATP-binding protein [Dehalococcoidales bacterium]
MAGSTPQRSLVEIQGLTKSFGHQRVLRGIDLEVKRGESVVIFGPNGAGKTTLIKVLATIMNPSSGTVLIDGLSPRNNAEEIRRRIGVVTHQTFLYSNLTAYENLEFYSRLYDVPGYKTRITEVAAMVAITSRLHDRVGTLSRGMQQRVSVARSLLHKPDLMLLDEAEAGLDQQAMSMLWEALRTGGERKHTTILTTHNLERGLELGDRLLILDKGQIVYEGTRKALDLAGLRQAYQHSTSVKV